MAAPLPTADIAAALSSSHRVKDAAIKLGMTAFGLERRCREQGLVALYEACAERGKFRRGRGKPSRVEPAMPRWSVVWLKPTTGSGTVGIWPRKIEAETEEEALIVAKQVTGRGEIAVMREIP